MTNGMLINGVIVPVDGVNVIGPHDTAWSHLSPGDCCPRHGPIQQWFIHKTIADDPEKLILGVGPSGDAGGTRPTAEYWAKDPNHSGAQLIGGHDGELACLCDIALVAAYHAQQSNMLSVGIETKEVYGGGFYEAAAKTVIAATLVGTRALGIQRMAQWPYHGRPLTRFADGGHTLYGIFGHRDNTSERGRWDPGDIIFDMLRDAGVVLLDYEANEDRAYVTKIQTELAADGFYTSTIDGLAGLGTRNALKAAGYIDGIYALGQG